MGLRIITVFVLFIAFTILILVNSVYGAEEIVVIVNESVSTDNLTWKTVSDIYTAEKTKWDNNVTIVVTMVHKGLIHERFVSDIVGITSKKLIRIWRGVIFSGKGNPPKFFKNETDLVKFISETKGAIGYISSSTPHDKVKVISNKKE